MRCACPITLWGQKRIGNRPEYAAMIESNQATIEHPTVNPEAGVAPIASIELDRFCTGCGYNLRTLPVSLDGHLGIPVVRCPECGRFQPANDASTALHPWLNRATTLLVITWMLIIAALFFHLGLAEGALSYLTLDELTMHGGYTTRTVSGGSTTTVYNRGLGALEIKPDDSDDALFAAMVISLSLATALVCGVLAVVVFPHWRRAACAAMVLVMPVVAGVVVAAIWGHEAPHLFAWGLPYMAGHAGVQVFGGLVGIAIGRPLARLVVCILLPPGVRPRLAYLWLVDDKPLPRP